MAILIRIKEEVDPYLEMSAIQLRVFQEEGKAVFFENVKGSKFPLFPIYLELLNKVDLSLEILLIMLKN